MNWRSRKFLGARVEAWVWAAFVVYGYVMGAMTW